jgi:transcriptional regulator with XRE-family HTH domain
MKIGDRLKEERERFALNQTDFAGLAGASRKSQFNYESGERMPDAAYLAAVAQIGVDVLYVVTGLRAENSATTPTELAYLRNCRSLLTPEAKQAGLDMLVMLRKAYGYELIYETPAADEPKND